MCVFTNRTARLRKEKTSEANQHRTKVHDYYKLSVRAAVASLQASNLVLDCILLNAGGMGSRGAASLTKGNEHHWSRSVHRGAPCGEPGRPWSQDYFQLLRVDCRHGPVPQARLRATHQGDSDKAHEQHTHWQTLKVDGPRVHGRVGVGCAKAIGTMYFQHLARIKTKLYIASVSPGATRGTTAMKFSSGWFKCLGGCP